jgi:hypothetical protein
MRIDVEPNSGLVITHKPRTVRRAIKIRSYRGRNPYRRRSNDGLFICCTTLLALTCYLLGRDSK